MTSLIFGSIYLAHKGATGAYRDKQRRKNYERWEGLRDEYDEQKKITRETRSLDIQRTGSEQYGYDESPIVSLRDLQEANDARTAWRPQETWEHSAPGTPQMRPQLTAIQPAQPQYSQQVDAAGRSVSVASTYWQGRGQLRPQKTGATWDDGLPERLRVSRRSFEDQDFNHYNSSRSNSIQMERTQSVQSNRSSNRSLSIKPAVTPVSVPTPGPASTSTYEEPVAMDPRFFEQLSSSTVTSPAQARTAPTPPHYQYFDPMKTPVTSAYPIYTTDPMESHVPGGRMAELIERGY